MANFTDGIPIATQTLGQTFQLIQDNFTNYRQVTEVNHENVNGANRGKHKFQQNPVQASAPSTGPDEMATYTKIINGNPRYFVRQANNGAEIQTSGPTPTIVGNKGLTYLPGGFCLQWGRIATNNTTRIWSDTFTPNFQLVYSMSAIFDSGNNRYVTVSGLSVSGFTVELNNNATGTILWMAIGSLS